MPFRSYPDLVASFPHVAHFTSEKPAPMTRLRLDERLARLAPDDRAQLLRGEPLAAWSPGAGLMRFHDDRIGAAEAEHIASEHLAEALGPGLHPGLRDYLEFRRDQRLFLMVLRQRRLGRGPELLAGLVPGFLPEALRRHLRLHWRDPDLNLGLRHPWLPELRRLLEGGSAVSLRRAMMEEAWTRLRRLRDLDPLGFPAVAAFFFSWQIAAAWASHDAAVAKGRFRRLYEETLPSPLPA
jgi:hypothetical protein